MNKKFFIIIIALLLVSALFSVSKMKSEAYPNMYINPPISILVLPPINYSTAADAKAFLSCTITKPLAEAGYYVYPIDVTDELLKSEGLYDTELITDEMLPQFKTITGADAVLIPELLYWDKNYYVIGGNVKVGVRYTLKSTLTSDVLWIYEGIMIVNTSNQQNTGGGAVGIFLALAATAIQTAAQDYFPIAEQINNKIFKTIPFGYYHPKYNLDQNYMISYPKKNAEFMNLANQQTLRKTTTTDSLADVKLVKKSSDKVRNIIQKKSRNPLLEYVILKDGRTIFGSIVGHKKKKVMLQKGATLITIYKVAIDHIENHAKEDITQTIFDTKYSRLNYNKYSDFEEIRK